MLTVYSYPAMAQGRCLGSRSSAWAPPSQVDPNVSLATVA